MAIYYVDLVAGNDNNPGTIGSPFKTLARLKTIGAGDTVILRGSATKETARLYAGAPFYSSDTGKNLFFENYPAEHVIIQDLTRTQAVTLETWTDGGATVRGDGSLVWGKALPRTQTSLAANAAAGAKNIKVVSTAGLVNGMWLSIGPGFSAQLRQIATNGVGTPGINGSGVTLTAALTVTYLAGGAVIPQTQTSWNKCSIQLTGCSGLHFDGNPERVPGFYGMAAASGTDMGFFLVRHTSRGNTDNLFEWIELTDNGCGFYARGNATETVPGDSGPGLHLRNIRAHHNNRMLSDAGGGGDSGGQGIGFERCNGASTSDLIIVEDFESYDNHAPSRDYGHDGCAFETYATSNIVFRRGRCWNNEGMFETGRGANRPYSTNQQILNIAFWGTTNIGNKTNGGSPTALLRDFRDSLLAHCTFDMDETNEIIALYDDMGTYGGDIARARIINNILVLRQDTGRPLIRATNLPVGADAPIIDGNGYWRPNGGTIIGSTDTGSKTWAQWQAAGYDPNGYNADPQFVDRAARDYRLSTV